MVLKNEVSMEWELDKIKIPDYDAVKTPTIILKRVQLWRLVWQDCTYLVDSWMPICMYILFRFTGKWKKDTEPFITIYCRLD